MSELQIFNNPEFGEIRIVERDGEPWFVGKDIAVALGYSNPRDALANHVDDEDKATVAIHDGSQNRNVTIISESGVYSLIFSSKLEKAKQFKRWVTAEVLPSIRKQGGYLTPEAADRLTVVVQERVQAAWAESFQKLATRVEHLEAVTDPFQIAPAAPAPLPAGGAPEAAHPGRDYMKRWMRTASEKLDLMSNKFNMSSNAILHKLYGYLEEDFGVVMADERLRIMEQFGLEDCSTLKAVFYDEELRDRLEELMDYNLAPENRGW